MTDLTSYWYCCPRCGHQNEPRARFCAGCGLRLPADESGLTGKPARRSKRHSRAWLIIGLILLGVILLATRWAREQQHSRHLSRETHRSHVIIHEQSTEYETDLH